MDLESLLFLLQQEFPSDRLHEVGCDTRNGARRDASGNVTDEWTKIEWRVQVGNTNVYGNTPELAIDALRKKLAEAAGIPEYAKQVAEVLRKIPAEGFVRSDVIRAAENILERER